MADAYRQSEESVGGPVGSAFGPPGEGSSAPEFVTDARVRVTRALRHLVDAAVTSEEVADDELDAVAAALEDLTERLGRPRPGSRGGPSGVRTRAEVGHLDYLPRSPLVGPISPLSPPFTWRSVEPGRIRADGVFHAPYEGPPGYVHGGWIALAFDEVLGMANIDHGTPGMTGRLSIRYRRPTPLHRAIVVEGWVHRTEGKRITVKGEMRVDDVVTAEAEGLFVMLDLESAQRYFGQEHAKTAPPTEA